MQNRYLILAAPLLSLVWLFATVLFGGMTYPDYNHFTQFISELGATGAPYGDLINYLGFIPTEIFIIIFVVSVYSVLAKTKLMISGISCIAIYAVALIVAAIFPCDSGCRPAEPSFSHNVHISFGMFAYLFGITGIILLSIDAKKWPKSKLVQFSGLCLGFISFFLLANFNPESKFVGLIQRATELSIYSWYLILAFYIYKHMPKKNNKPMQKNR